MSIDIKPEVIYAFLKIIRSQNDPISQEILEKLKAAVGSNQLISYLVSTWKTRAQILSFLKVTLSQQFKQIEKMLNDFYAEYSDPLVAEPKIITDPVFLKFDQKRYERSTLLKHLQTHSTSPSTGEKLDDSQKKFSPSPETKIFLEKESDKIVEMAMELVPTLLEYLRSDENQEFKKFLERFFALNELFTTNNEEFDKLRDIFYREILNPPEVSKQSDASKFDDLIKGKDVNKTIDFYVSTIEKSEMKEDEKVLCFRKIIGMQEKTVDQMVRIAQLTKNRPRAVGTPRMLMKKIRETGNVQLMGAFMNLYPEESVKILKNEGWLSSCKSLEEKLILLRVASKNVRNDAPLVNFVLENMEFGNLGEFQKVYNAIGMKPENLMYFFLTKMKKNKKEEPKVNKTQELKELQDREEYREFVHKRFEMMNEKIRSLTNELETMKIFVQDVAQLKENFKSHSEKLEQFEKVENTNSDENEISFDQFLAKDEEFLSGEFVEMEDEEVEDTKEIEKEEESSDQDKEELPPEQEKEIEFPTDGFGKLNYDMIDESEFDLDYYGTVVEPTIATIMEPISQPEVKKKKKKTQKKKKKKKKILGVTEDDAQMKIYVGNLPFKIRATKIKEFFEMNVEIPSCVKRIEFIDAGEVHVEFKSLRSLNRAFKLEDGYSINNLEPDIFALPKKVSSEKYCVVIGGIKKMRIFSTDQHKEVKLALLRACGGPMFYFKPSHTGVYHVRWVKKNNMEKCLQLNSRDIEVGEKKYLYTITVKVNEEKTDKYLGKYK